MLKLWAVYVGGWAGSGSNEANIELHDMRFVLAETIEDAYDDLRAQWWGRPDSLHLDAWGALESADGHDIVLKPEQPPKDANKLYFVNLGGYDDTFTELHKNVFVVAENDSKAKVKALKQILDWGSHHRDNLFEIEKMMQLNDVAAKHGLHIHLVPTDHPKPFEFKAKFVPIGENKKGARHVADN